ncbi:hydroxyproline dehydrogenase-like isoform X2 [Gordionus sp. m RMFG-2023]|uniref:hydroxyproline dehydrogenase-like isoform X2 n=1 Tax=Gordionus sp. m RMFG-2023 TaxID=3053472 RepID=UPI0031FC50F5
MNRISKFYFFLGPLISHKIPSITKPKNCFKLNFTTLNRPIGNIYLVNKKIMCRTFYNTYTYRNLSSLSGASSLNEHKLSSSILPYIKFDDNPPLEMYKDVSTFELLKTLFVMELCSIPFLVKNADKLIALAEMMMGKHFCNKIIKSTIFHQFVAGESIEDVVRILNHLKVKGVSPFIAVPIEELPYNEDDGIVKEGGFDEIFAKNVAYIMESLHLFAQNFPNCHTTINFKISSLIPTKLMEEFCENVLPRLSTDWCSNVQALQNSPIFNSALSEEYKTVIIKGLKTLENMCQDIFNYLKRDVEFCQKNDLNFNCKLVRGAYIEWERDLALKKKINSPICQTYELTNQNYDQAVNFCLDKIGGTSNHLKNFAKDKETDSKLHFMIASHNITSINSALKKMKDLNISLDDYRVSFAQLYGMCDYLTYFLVKNSASKLLVYKNLPYGSVESVIPYLLRRARENFTVFIRLSFEKKYLRRELRNRLPIPL